MSNQSILLKFRVAMALLMTVTYSVGCSAGASDAAISKAAAEAEAADESMAASRAVASKESIFVVQVGTFKVEANAKKMTESLSKTGLPVLMKKFVRSNGDVLFTVRMEPTPSRVEAEKFAATIKSEVGVSALILSVGR